MKMETNQLASVHFRQCYECVAMWHIIDFNKDIGMALRQQVHIEILKKKSISCFS